MSICENCENEHKGEYGSGRFCSVKCSRGFSTKEKRKEINEKVSKSLMGNIPWHKGKTGVYSKEIIEKMSISSKKYAKNNPEEIRLRNLGKKWSEERKKEHSLNMQGKTGGYREKGGRGKQGWFNGIFCNSSWELAYVIYSRDHEIEIVRNTKGFEYKFENRNYKFYPDFIVGEKYVEIKGYFDKKNISKISEFPHPLKIISKKEINKYIDYVIDKYGKDFISMYEKNN